MPPITFELSLQKIVSNGSRTRYNTHSNTIFSTINPRQLPINHLQAPRVADSRNCRLTTCSVSKSTSKIILIRFFALVMSTKMSKSIWFGFKESALINLVMTWVVTQFWATALKPPRTAMGSKLKLIFAIWELQRDILNRSGLGLVGRYHYRTHGLEHGKLPRGERVNN
jgi:hypothetical protein